MQQTEVEKTQITTLLGIFFMIMMAVFAAEVTVMQLYGDLFTHVSIVHGAFLDSSTLVLIIALPLWFFVFRPAFREKIRKDGAYASIAFFLYLKILAGLFLIQLLIMFFLPDLLVHVPPTLENLADGALTVLFSAPLFWWLLYRLELHYRLEPLADFIDAPTTLYILLLFMIFLADMLQEIIFPQLHLQMSDVQFQLFDALITVLLIAPLLFILVVRPLRRLARSEMARSNAIYDQVVDAIVKTDQEGTIASFNLAAQNIFGFRADEMIGKPTSILLDSEQIDLPALLQQLATDAEADPVKFNELIASRRDGSDLVLDVSISKIKLEGPDEFLLLLRDISDRKAAEDALLATDAIFREIFNQSEDAILFFEPGSGDILDVNARTEALYGFSKRELQEQGIKAFCDQDVLARLAEMIRGISTSGSAQIDRLVNLRQDGSAIVVSIRGKMMTLQGAQVIYCTVRDISERVRLENEALEIQAKLIHANKMTSLGLLVSGVAHEINNPNNYVLSNAQLLSKIWKDALIILEQYYQEHGDFLVGGIKFSELEDHTPEIFHGITDGSRRINAIVTDLKRFVRQDTTLMMAEVDINKVVSSAVSMLHHELIKHTDNLQVRLVENLPPVRGSSQQLGQVIINLLMNACQALPDKSCTVRLETAHDTETGQVRISVSDQGCGLSDEAGEKIFEPFFTTKMEVGGTGLGLSISQTIVKDHGGQIDFSTETNKGTTFIVRLPVERCENRQERDVRTGKNGM